METLLLPCLLCILLFVLHLAIGPDVASGSSVGVCFGTQGDKMPTPEEVVAMYKSHDIKRMRLYEPNNAILQSLRESSIEVVIGIGNDHLPFLATSFHFAQIWVSSHILSYWPDVCFRYIAVGNEAIPGTYGKYVLQAILNLNLALKENGLLHRIKVSTTIGTSVLDVLPRPSSCSFSNKTVEYMKPLSSVLYATGAPLLVNVHPYFNFNKTSSDSLNYAIFLSQKMVVIDGSFRYQNLFEEMLDRFYASLEKLGKSGVSIVVAETGWPVTGDSHFETHEIAKLYISNLVKHVLSPQGTPRRRGSIETYLYSMFNENKINDHRKRYWGLFSSNKNPIVIAKFNQC